ncbi:MAG TPA: ATP-binding protein [Acidimicrobiia bacterium]|nr:ATP-binding protein [Acidimicrobiia bacterium]
MQERKLMELPWTASSPRLARTALQHWGANLEAEVVVSELVMNAVRHGAPPVSLVAERTAETFRVGVCDDRHDMGAPGPDSVGLQLVEAFATTWGVTPIRGDGKCVWAEFPA